MTKKQKPVWVAHLAIILVALAIVGGFVAWAQSAGKVEQQQREMQQQQREQSVVQVDTTFGEAPRERLVTLKDGRKVLCINWSEGPSCDWGNAK